MAPRGKNGLFRDPGLQIGECANRLETADLTTDIVTIKSNLFSLNGIITAWVDVNGGISPILTSFHVGFRYCDRFITAVRGS